MIEAMGHLDMQQKPHRIDVPTTERQLSTNVILPTGHGFEINDQQEQLLQLWMEDARPCASAEKHKLGAHRMAFQIRGTGRFQDACGGCGRITND